MPKRPITVVVVDDHEMILQSLVRLLTADSQFVVVGTALNATSGVELATRLAPDVLVIDYHLPDMSAPDAIRLLRESNTTTKVVTMSGSDRPGALQASLRAGSYAWVSKTRAIQDLRDAIVRAAAGLLFANKELAALPKVEELVAHYQPIVSLVDGRIVGFEALVRWQHPERGLLFPESFLPLAEETGYIEEIDHWVRQVATKQLAIWQQRYPATPHLWIGINLSVHDLSDPDLFDSIAAAIADAGVDANDVIFEVVETVLLEDSDKTIAFLSKLKELGVGLALDDFGTGFSSISYVRRFPFDHLKLDISFTSELPDSLRSMLLVEDICGMAISMRMKGVAEGIERQDQLDALREIGWQFGQGYLLSRPLVAEECDALFERPTMFPVLL